MFRLVLGLVFCAIGTTVAIYLASPANRFGFSEINNVGIPGIALISLPIVMLLGIAAYSIHIQLKKVSKETEVVSYREILQGSFKTKGFLQAIIVSPIVFAGIYGLVKSQPDLLLSHLIAFENGFFWQAILDERKQS